MNGSATGNVNAAGGNFCASLLDLPEKEGFGKMPARLRPMEEWHYGIEPI